ncbi:hypothetical protein N0V90_004608 [Kalmusia sp. IMI 367209]|nr:hypothetical protein N0V90_004608 [Kalmusia sp. IMI 367209]
MVDFSSGSAVDSSGTSPIKPAFLYGAAEEDSETNVPNRDVSGDILDDGLRRGLKGRHFVIIALGNWNSAILTLRFWISDDKMPSWAWTLIFFVVFTVMTLLGVRVYGEIEYYFGMFKFGSLIVLFVLSIVSNAGGFGGGYTGFRYWKAPTDLLSASSKTASSPFTIGFVKDGWKSAGHFVNALILVAFVSAANGVVYVQSRTVYSLALTNRAPRIFAKTTSRGVPWVAIVTSNLWGFLCLMNRRLSAGQVFSYMTSVGGTAAYIAWASIIFTHLWIRAAANRQGIDIRTFPYRAWGSIWIYRFNFAFNIFLLFIQGYTVFKHPFDWRNFIACYITIPTFLVLFWGYKFWFKTTWVTLDRVNFSDRREWVAQTSGAKAAQRSLKRRALDLLKD